MSNRLRSIFVSKSGLRAGWSLLLWLVAFGVIAGLLAGIAQYFLHGQKTPKGLPVKPVYMLIGEAGSLLATAVATWLMSRVERKSFASFGLSSGGLLFDCLTGVGSGLVLISGLVVALKACGWLVFDFRLLFGWTVVEYALVWGVAFFLLGMFEETFLRGYAQRTLGRGIGFWPAAFILSFIFGLVHKNNAGESLVGLLSAGLIGLVFCFSLQRTGTLWWAIGFHAAWDWGESFLYGVPNSGVVDEGRLFSVHTNGPTWLSGGTTGPEGSLLVLVAIALAAGIVFWILPARSAGQSEARPLKVWP